MAIEIRLAVPKEAEPNALGSGRSLDPWVEAKPVDVELLETLQWLLTQASGTIAAVADQLERRAANIDDGIRAQLRDDVLVLGDELEVV